MIAGYWVWRVQSIDEAVEWLKRAPFDEGAEIEIRPFHEMEDFGSDLTPELREQEHLICEQLGGKKVPPLSILAYAIRPTSRKKFSKSPGERFMQLNPYVHSMVGVQKHSGSINKP